MSDDAKPDDHGPHDVVVKTINAEGKPSYRILARQVPGDVRTVADFIAWQLSEEARMLEQACAVIASLTGATINGIAPAPPIFTLQ